MKNRELCQNIIRQLPAKIAEHNEIEFCTSMINGQQPDDRFKFSLKIHWGKFETSSLASIMFHEQNELYELNSININLSTRDLLPEISLEENDLEVLIKSYSDLIIKYTENSIPVE